MAKIKTYGSKYPVVAYVDAKTLEKIENARGKIPRAHFLEEMIINNFNTTGDKKDEDNCT